VRANHHSILSHPERKIGRDLPENGTGAKKTASLKALKLHNTIIHLNWELTLEKACCKTSAYCTLYV
jgi:hypothetical protein